MRLCVRYIIVTGLVMRYNFMICFVPIITVIDICLNWNNLLCNDLFSAQVYIHNSIIYSNEYADIQIKSSCDKDRIHLLYVPCAFRTVESIVLYSNGPVIALKNNYYSTMYLFFLFYLLFLKLPRSVSLFFSCI